MHLASRRGWLLQGHIGVVTYSWCHDLGLLDLRSRHNFDVATYFVQTRLKLCCDLVGRSTSRHRLDVTTWFDGAWVCDQKLASLLG